MNSSQDSSIIAMDLSSPYYSSNPFPRNSFQGNSSSFRDIFIFEQRIVRNLSDQFYEAIKYSTMLSLCILFSLYSLYWHVNSNNYFSTCALLVSMYLISAFYFTGCGDRLYMGCFYRYQVNRALRQLNVQVDRNGLKFFKVPSDFVNKYNKYKKKIAAMK